MNFVLSKTLFLPDIYNLSYGFQSNTLFSVSTVDLSSWIYDHDTNLLY